MGGRSLKLDPEFKGEYAEFPDRLTRHLIAVKRVAEKRDGAARDKAGRDRRQRKADGRRGGVVRVAVVEKRRLGRREKER